MNERSAVTTASGRRAWAVRRLQLGAESPAELAATTTAGERLAMMWRLTLDAWASAGRSLPDYARGATPVRRRRLDEADAR